MHNNLYKTLEVTFSLSFHGSSSCAWCRYSLIRQQFGPPNKPEISILDYQSQQQKLMPMLSSAYAFHFATQYLVSYSSSDGILRIAKGE